MSCHSDTKRNHDHFSHGDAFYLRVHQAEDLQRFVSGRAVGQFNKNTLPSF